MSAIDVLEGGTAPPRSNGELVFEEPWESRAFGAAVALQDAGAIDFERFRARLIESIAGRESESAPDEARYYALWLEALEQTVVDAGLVTLDELAHARAHVEHAHAHDHDHLGHGH